MSITLPHVDLAKLIAADIGPPDRNRKWLCPFHDDRNSPNLSIDREGKRWKCWACGASGDAVEWLRRRDGLDFKAAVARLGGQVQAYSPCAKPRPAFKPPLPAPAKDWQASASRLVDASVRNLWVPSGAKALAWLRQRGLKGETIRQARLGYHPAETPDADRGIVIPWFASGTVRFVQIRRPHGKPKYKATAGGSRGDFYPCPPAPGRVVLVCEGEFDCLLMRQEAADLVEAITLGGAADKLTGSAALAICFAPLVLVATDNDVAGDNAAQGWLEVTARARRIRPPARKDLTEAFLSGADLREWIADELPKILPSLTKAADDGWEFIRRELDAEDLRLSAG